MNKENEQSILLDLTEEFTNLKEVYSCSACDTICKQIFKISKCNHKFCQSCVKKINNKCKICNISLTTQNVKEVSFDSGIIDCLCRMKETFSSDNVSVQNSAFLDNLQNPIVVASNVKCNAKGETSLHKSCRKGDIEKSKEFISNGINLNAKDFAGWAALHEAVEGKNIECVELLLKQGALPDIPGENYSTPLHLAIMNGSTEIAKVLLKYGASKFCKDYFGKTPMDYVPESFKSEFEDQTVEHVIVPKYFLSPNTVVHFSSIPPQSITKLRKCPNVKIISEADYLNKNDVTHFVTSDKESLSMKILVATLKGVFVVGESWVDSYISNQDPKLAFNYLLETNRNAYESAILNKLRGLPKLFDGINFYITDNKCTHSVNGVEFKTTELAKLVEIGGGSILHRAPALRTVSDQECQPYHADKNSNLTYCANYIIYNEGHQPELLYNMKELQHKSSTWLIKCILNFNISH